MARRGAVESRVTAYVVESIMGLRDLQITGLLSRRIRRFLGLSGAARDASRTAFSMMGTLRPGMRLIGYLTLCLVLAAGGVRVMQDAISLGTLTALVLYTRNFFAPMEQLGSFYNAFQSARSALERIAMLFVDWSPGRRLLLARPGARQRRDRHRRRAVAATSPGVPGATPVLLLG